MINPIAKDVAQLNLEEDTEKIYNENNCVDMVDEEDEDEFGKVIGDEIYSPLDLLAHCGYDYENVDEDISWEEFEEAYPNLWTYPLSDMTECLRNNDEVMIVRFFDQSKEDGFVYRACQASE